MLSTISAGLHKEGDLEIIADWGFDYVMGCQPIENTVWENEIDLIHKASMKSIPRWPNIQHLGLSTPKYGFSAYDGRNNNDYAGAGGQVNGPSHWNKEAEDISIESLRSLINMGIDGVTIGMLINDRPYPTDWYPFGDNAIRGTKMYWSFDDAAQAQWKEFSGGEPMPETCQCFDGICEEKQRDFYKWYQDGWISKLIRLTDVAIDAGLKHIWTWMIPHTAWTEVNMADGTADSIAPMDKWQQHVISRGAKPVVVVACHAGLRGDWPVWFADGNASIKNATSEPFNWKMIGGAETGHTPGTVAANLIKNSKDGIDIGFSGMLCGDTVPLGAESFYDKYRDAFIEAKGMFTDS